MNEILKIKDWSKSNNQQFKVSKFIDGDAYDVERISDGRALKIGLFYQMENNNSNSESNLMIYEFSEDNIHVKFEITIIENGGSLTHSVGVCEINNIIFNNSNIIIGIQR